MKDYSFYKRALKLDKKNAGKYYAGRAVLYFYDMEYELAWQDFQKAKKHGFNLDYVAQYTKLLLCKRIENNEFEFSENKNSGRDFHYLVNYHLLKHNYSQVMAMFAEKFTTTTPNSPFVRILFKIALFETEKYELKDYIARHPDLIISYYRRINFYIQNKEFYDGDYEKRFYRQRINQDFDKLEKLSKNPEYVNLYRSKFHENLYEYRYAIKFCKKSMEISQAKKNDGLTYVIAVILKNLYIKINDLESAKEMATLCIDLRPPAETVKYELLKFLKVYKRLEVPRELEKYTRNVYNIPKSALKKLKEIKKRKNYAKNNNR